MHIHCLLLGTAFNLCFMNMHNIIIIIMIIFVTSSLQVIMFPNQFAVIPVQNLFDCNL